MDITAIERKQLTRLTPRNTRTPREVTSQRLTDMNTSFISAAKSQGGSIGVSRAAEITGSSTECARHQLSKLVKMGYMTMAHGEKSNSATTYTLAKG